MGSEALVAAKLSFRFVTSALASGWFTIPLLFYHQVSKLNLLKTILALVVVAAVFFGYAIKSTSAPRYFAEVHIGEPEIKSQVQAFIIFDRVPKLDSPAGLAHYTEHLVALSALTEDFKAADRHANAYTSATTVGYWVKGPKEDLPLMIKNLGGVFDPISLDIKFANEEAGIVRREYDLRATFSVNYFAYEAMTPFLYEGNSIGDWGSSTPQSIASLDYDQAVSYFNATHQQRSAVLLVLGDVSKEQVRKAVNTSGLEPLTEPAVEIQANTFTLAGSATKNFTFKQSSAEPRIIFRKIVALDKAVNYDLLQFQTSQLRAVLDTNLPGGIAGPLRYDKFVARNFELSIHALDEQHVELWFVASPDKGVSFKQLQSTFEDTLIVASNGIPADTYERVQARSKQYWVDWDDENKSAKWMSTYTRSRVTNLRSPMPKENLVKMTENVSLNDINALLKALQKSGRQSVAYIGIDEEDDQ